MNDVKAVDPVLRRLSSIENEWPALTEAAQFYRAVLPVLADAVHDENWSQPIPMTEEEARAKMDAGLPLLNGVEIELDVDAVQQLVTLLSRAIGKEDSQIAERIRIALENDLFDMAGLIQSVIAGEKNRVTAIAQDLTLDPDLLWILFRNATKPALRAWSRQLMTLAQGVAWEEGYCFVCGTRALFAELRNDNQIKHLRCGLCGADWRARRLRCTYCGNDAHDALGYLYAEDRPGNIRAETCDACGGYLKVINSFSPISLDMIEVEDLAAKYLDYIAGERGYTRDPRIIGKGTEG